MKAFDFNEVYIFIHVVKAGSFTKAAKNLKMPTSTVSARISSLEKRLNTTLIQRTTRQLKITQSGELYYQQCLKGVEEIEDAENHLNESHEEPSGLIRITAPVFLGGSLLPPIAAKLSKRFPKLTFELILQDEPIGLIENRVDLAIRASKLKDSNLITKKVSEAEFFAYASPRYLKQHGTPTNPKELVNHQCVQFSSLKIEKWPFSKDRKNYKVNIPEVMKTNDLNTAKNLVVSGNGIGLLPSFMTECKQEKFLKKLFPGWKSLTKSIQLLYPPQRYPSVKMRALVETAEKVIKENGH